MSVTSTAPETRRISARRARKGRFAPWLLPPLIVILGAAGWLAWRLAQTPASTTAGTTVTVSRGTLSVTVSGSGAVQPASSRTLAFPVAGTVATVLVEVGDSVTAGQTLATLDTTDLAMAVRQAAASLKSARAQLAAANGAGATLAEIAAAELQLQSAQASLAKTRKGSATAADIASAEAQLQAAQAQLAELLAGPGADTLSTARARVEQARLTLESQRTSLSAAKTQAASALATAADSLRTAQDDYSRIYWQNRQLDKAPGELPQANRDEEAAALRAVRGAEASLQQARLAYQQAQQDEITGIAQAESDLRDAEEQLRALTDGPTAAELASARASVASAQANLNSLRQPASAEDLAIAAASVEQARINLAQLTSPGSAASIASAEASVAQAEVAYDQAKLNLERATLTAPFAGVVSEVLVNPGDTASSSTTITVIDTAAMYVELSLSESDASLVEAGQPVALSFDALPEVTIAAVVDRVAPTATVSSNVATYAVRVRFTPGDAAVKAGMTASGTITVAERADALLAPSRAVQSQGGAQVVQVRPSAGQPPVTVRVKTGLSSGGQTEILSCVDTGSLCLQEGDTLLVTTTTGTSTTNSGRTNGLGGFGGGPPPGDFVRRP